MERKEYQIDLELFPSSIRNFATGAKIYDSSCSRLAQTFLIDGADKAYLKISASGSLERECRMTEFLNGHQVAPKVIAFVSDSSKDYLLTEAVSGEDGVSGGHLENPKRLADAFGDYLRMLHSLPTSGCPYPGRTAEMLAEARGQKANLEALQKYQGTAFDDVIIHGDYCLPNIMMDQYRFKGFIDLGSGGIGDRHYDLYWGIWTLNYNLKTDQYKDIFLDAYGRTEVDPDRLKDCALLAQLAE